MDAEKKKYAKLLDDVLFYGYKHGYLCVETCFVVTCEIYGNEIEDYLKETEQELKE